MLKSFFLALCIYAYITIHLFPPSDTQARTYRVNEVCHNKKNASHAQFKSFLTCIELVRQDEEGNRPGGAWGEVRPG